MLNLPTATILVLSCVSTFGQICQYKYFNDVTVNVVTVDKVKVAYVLQNCSLSPEVLPETSFEIVVKNQSMFDISPLGVSNLPHLKSLTLVGNGITAIRTNAFYNLPSLTHLRLDQNRIEVVWFASMSGVRAVQNLSYSDNRISEIDQTAFSFLKQLRVVSFNNNRLKAWKNSWFEYADKLTEIHMRANQLRLLPPDSFANNPELRVLDFSFNRLKSVHSEAFDGLAKLKILNLSNNKLFTFVDGTFSTLKVESLYLHVNELSFLRAGMLANLTDTKYLSIHSNPFQCACEKAVLSWAFRAGVKINENSQSCLSVRNPVCINPLYSDTEACVETFDKELQLSYFEQFESVENHTETDLRCF